MLSKEWKKVMRKYNLPIFIPHRGCPHHCVFCNQKKITGVDTDIKTDDVRCMIDRFLSTIKTDNASVEVAFFGGSFTGLEHETQGRLLSVAAEFFPRVSGIRLSTRPDYISREVLDLLAKYNVTTIELGVQSSNDEVLRLNNRGHSFDDVKKASEMIKARGISLGHQMMLGMYGADPQKDMQTVRDIIELQPDCVRIYPVVTLRDTKLQKLYENGEYQPYTVDKAAELAKEAVCMFRENGIDVIRVGLHSSEELDTGDSVIAGPYHQAFGELVESLCFRDVIEKEIQKKDLRNCAFEFACKPNDVSKVIGHKRMNKEYFMKKYNIQLKAVVQKG